MKKRLLSALLALALVFVLLPTTALADTTPETDGNVKINGTPVTVGNGISLGEGNGTYSYDKATHTLTLNSATINATGSNIGIDFCDTTNYVTYSVILTGENTVTSNNIAIETTPNTNLTFTGGGNLKAITNGYYQAIRVYGTLTIDNSTLIAESSAYTATTVIWTLAMTGNNAKLEISNKSAANIVAGTAGPASNIDWSNYQFTTGSYSGDALTESDPEVCSWGTLKKYFGYPTKEYSQYICIAKRTIALETTSDVRIAGDPAVVGVETSIPSANGSGTYYYDQASKTLTLNNVNIASSSIINGIQFTKDGTYTIKLVGTNTMSGFSTGISANSADQYVSNINITVTGAGSLEVSTTSYAIDMNKGDLKFEDVGNITLTTSNISTNRNVLSVSGNITITDMSKYSVTGTQQTGGKPLGSEVSLTEASQLKGGTTGYRIITITPAALEKSNVYVAGTNLYKNTAYTIQNGKPVMGGTYPGNYNIYFDATDYVLHVKGANIDARGTSGIYGTSNIVFEGKNSITASTYGIYSYFKSSDLKISGTGSLEVKTIAGDPAIATAYDTSRSIIISGNDFTVTADTSGTTSYAIKSDKDLTITDGAAVIAKSNATRAIDIDGDLTVTNGSLKATSNSDSVPTVQVGGNASFTGSTVTVTNHSTALHKDAADKIKGDSVSSALYVKGNINTDNANVTAKVENGGGNAIGAVGNITVNGSTVTAVNKGQKFTTIIAENVYVSGDSKITANNLNKNPPYKDSYLAFPAIEGKIVNQNTDYSLKFEGQHSRTSVPKTTLAPGEQTTLYYYNVTITRGDEVTSTQSPVVIDGTTLLNDTYYTITNGTVAEGTESNYNAFYDSETKTLKLNNAKISHSFAYEDGGGQDGAIIFKEFENYFIELSGENTISSTNTYAINCHRPDRTLTIKNAAEAENAKLTLTSNWMVICSIGGLNIQSDVTMVNTKRADYLMYVNGTFSYTGYNAYASTEASGSPLEVYNPQNYSTYKYLRITKENLAPTTPTTYTVTITAGDNMKHESGALTQEVTKGAAITEVKFMAASGHYFPADYVSKMNLPAGLTAEIRENSWYLIISGTPTSDVTINLPAASVRPTITVSMPTPVAGNTPATASNITLTYSDINKSISKNLTISNVVWQSYVPNGDGSITPGEALSSGDKFVEGTKYRVTISFEGVSEDYAIVPAAGTTAWSNAEWGSRTMTLHFDATGAPCTHEYTDDWHANGNTHWHECKLCGAHADEVAHTFGDWITDTPATDTTDGSKHRICSVCQYRENATIPKTGTGEIVPPTPDNPGTIVIIRPAEEEKPAQQPNPSTGANDLVGLAVAAAVAAALGSAALLRKHD